MKKLLIIALVLVMILSLAACAGETTDPVEGKTTAPTATILPDSTVKLVDVTTDQGISLKLPSDMKIQENKTYANNDTLDVAVVMVLDEAPDAYSEWKQEDFVGSELKGIKDVAVKSYVNNIKINGYDALRCTYTYSSEKGTTIASEIVMITDGVKECIANFLYASSNTNGSLAKNLQACIDSLTFKTA